MSRFPIGLVPGVRSVRAWICQGSAPSGLLMRVDILTIFPGLFSGFLGESLVKSARDRGLVDLRLWDFRDYATDRHRSVDDKPFGGGPGMVLKPEPVFACLDQVIGRQPRPRMLLPSPVGRPFDQDLVRELAREPRLAILCARYEGYDERIVEGWDFEEVSIGDYVLMGGEIPAMVILEAVIRLLPGVVGHDLATSQESFEGAQLEHPQYTRPAEFQGMQVPEVLRSGDHARVAQWKQEQSGKRTRERRPDLLSPEARREQARPER
jgi:tRNA (guanine37-N1)-methyltransferase